MREKGTIAIVFFDFNLDSVDSNQQTLEILGHDWQHIGSTPEKVPQISLASLCYKTLPCDIHPEKTQVCNYIDIVLLLFKYTTFIFDADNLVIFIFIFIFITGWKLTA
jgi:hypothetical protein